ncbi:unnamed protein product, partial [Rotaria sp. Silwood1]
CPAVRNYRREVIKHIQLHPEILPEHVQIFIPSYCRQNGGKVLGNQRSYSQQQQYVNLNLNYPDANRDWPSLPPPISNTTTYLNHYQQYQNRPDQLNDIQMKMNKFERECEDAKNEFDRKNLDIITKFNTSIVQIQALISCFSTVIQRQNEMILVLKSAVIECLNLNRITNQVTCSLLDKNGGDQQHNEVICKLTSIPIDDRCESIEKLFSIYSPLIEDFTKKIMDVTNQLVV